MLRTISFLIVLILLSFGVWYGITNNQQKLMEQYVTQEITFINVHDEPATILFNLEQNTATLFYDEYQEIKLVGVEADLGSKYVNEEYNITVWHKGEDVTIYKDDQIIFTNIIEVVRDTFNPEQSDSLEGFVWIWEQTIMNNDDIINPNNPGVFSLTFEDGKVFGKTDCNNFSGSYQTQNNRILFTPFVSTLMYCEGSQENQFAQMISNSDSFMFDGDGNLILLIKFDSGSVIFTKQD